MSSTCCSTFDRYAVAWLESVGMRGVERDAELVRLVCSAFGRYARFSMTSETSSIGEIARRVLESSQNGPALAACTVISAADGAGAEPGAKLLVYEDGTKVGSLGSSPEPGLSDAVVAAAIDAIPKHSVATLAFSPAGAALVGRRVVEAAEAVVEVLVEVVEPAAVLLVVGGGHVGRAVAELGAFLDMSVSVLDDRDEYANQERFPFADHVILGDFEPELERFPFTSNTFVVLVSRGHLVDELSLRQVIQHDVAYVGMIGSKRRTRTVLEHLASENVPAERLARVYTPIGLDIEAETPEEIAISVLAEIVLLRRGGRGAPLSDAGETLIANRGNRRSDTI